MDFPRQFGYPWKNRVLETNWIWLWKGFEKSANGNKLKASFDMHGKTADEVILLRKPVLNLSALEKVWIIETKYQENRKIESTALWVPPFK
jgi:hypothetical protein